MERARYRRGVVLAALYAGSIVLAAYLVIVIGPVPVGFGLMAPAAAYVVGVSLVLRDLAQDQLGPWWTCVAILVGALFTVLLSPTLALASGVAFLGSELLDMLVYTPLRERGRFIAAIFASNVVGSVVDSFVFLMLAFGSLQFFAGQVWAKMASTVVAALVIWLLHRHRTDRRPAYIVAREARKSAEQPA